MSYGQMHVTSGDAPALIPETGKTNGLCGSASPGSLWMITASCDGDVRLRCELAERPVDEAEWDEVVECTFAPTCTPVLLASWAQEVTHELALPPGMYRVRYCGRGLDGDTTGAFLRREVQPDEYLLAFWPSEARVAERVVKSTTAAGRYWHETAGTG